MHTACRRKYRVLSTPGAITSIVILQLATNARAGVYAYTHIADTTMTFPAINNSGLVAFEAGGVYTGNGGALTLISATAAGGVYNAWINDSGQVAFVNNPSLGTFSVSSGSGGPLTTIHTYTTSPNQLTYTTPVIANDGTVSYLSPNSGIFSGTGGAVTTVLGIAGTSATQYSGAFEGLAVSRNGTLAYEKYASPSASGQSQIVVNRVGIETVIATVWAENSISVNNSGVVATNATILPFGTNGIYVGNGASLNEIIPSSPSFQPINTVSINDSGELAFLANFFPAGNTFNGIYTGPDPLNDKIIQTGDLLSGSAVTKLRIGTDAINDSDEVTFWAQLANGTSAVYTATPVPEPSSLAIVLIGAGTACVRKRRRLQK